LARVPHHLVAIFDLREEMSAVRFAERAREAIASIRARGRLPIVVGGSGLYVRALISGFSPLPPADPAMRAWLENFSLGELNARLHLLDPKSVDVIDKANRRRVARALEIFLLTGQAASAQRSKQSENVQGIFLFRDRDDLYRRIDVRVEQMFACGVVEEVESVRAIGRTAEQTLGWREIRELLAGKITRADCIASIQRATRRYAKRQLTWFRHQTNFAQLNLTGLTNSEAIEQIAQQARRALAT
jgi:tRNA dimethylallyltransferase